MAIMGKRELKYDKIRKAVPTGLYIYRANILVCLHLKITCYIGLSINKAFICIICLNLLQ